MFNKDLMYMRVGRGLGKFQQADGSFVYGVKSAGKRIILSESYYKIWQTAHFSCHTIEEFIPLLELDPDDILKHMNVLKKQKLIIELKELFSPTVRLGYMAIPKGYIVDKGNNEFELTEFLNAHSHKLPLMAVTVWRLANPSYSLDVLIKSLVEVMDMSKKDVIDMLALVIPYLISRGVLIARPSVVNIIISI